MPAALHELLVHGLRYVWPATEGALTRGVPTAHGAPPLNAEILGSEAPPVWPHASGTVRGPSIEPLYKTAPDAALRDPGLHERLALCDALRIGAARERNLAADLLATHLGLKARG